MPNQDLDPQAAAALIAEKEAFCNKLVASLFRKDLLLYSARSNNSHPSLVHLGVIDRWDSQGNISFEKNTLILHPGIYLSPDRKRLFHTPPSHNSVSVRNIETYRVGKERIVEYLSAIPDLRHHAEKISKLERPYVLWVPSSIPLTPA